MELSTTGSITEMQMRSSTGISRSAIKIGGIVEGNRTWAYRDRRRSRPEERVGEGKEEREGDGENDRWGQAEAKSTHLPAWME